MDTVETSLPASDQAPALARRFLRSVLRTWQVDDSDHVAALLLSELVSNAVIHVHEPVTVRVARRATSIRVEVDDGSATAPVLRSPDTTTQGGRGVVLVDTLAQAWGADLRPGGKTVWFELDATAELSDLVADDGVGWSETSEDVQERLAHLQALTDTGLTRLDVDDLLGELLVRVREILDADTAAVLLLDGDSGDLVARATCGIEEEVRQGVRVPLGAGFAGRIAASRGPIRLDRVDASTVSNPILWERGIKTMLGVPLLSGESVLGVLHVGRTEDRPFSADDVELLQVVADRVAGSAQARLLAIEQAAAGLLERSLLPGMLPVCPGLEFAARYVTAEDRAVGGDWYDLFTVPSGQLWIVAGDVAGHGLQAAVVMGRIRSALRAYTLLDIPPEQVLDLVDRKVDHFEIGTIATVVCAVSEPPYDTMTLAVAGHPPPVIAVPDRPTAFASVKVTPPLGAAAHVPRTSTTLALAPGTVAAFYTDGLVERRGESIELGLERLRNAVTPDAPNKVARDIMRKLVAHTAPRDDIALVIIRRTDERTHTC